MAGMKNEALKPAVIFEVFVPRIRNGDVTLTGPLPPQAVTPQARPVRPLPARHVHPTKKQSAD